MTGQRKKEEKIERGLKANTQDAERVCRLKDGLKWRENERKPFFYFASE